MSLLPRSVSRCCSHSLGWFWGWNCVSGDPAGSLGRVRSPTGSARAVPEPLGVRLCCGKFPLGKSRVRRESVPWGTRSHRLSPIPATGKSRLPRSPPGSVPLCPSLWGQDRVLPPLQRLWQLLVSDRELQFPFCLGSHRGHVSAEAASQAGQTLPSSAELLCGTPERPQEPSPGTLRAPPGPRHRSCAGPCSQGTTGLKSPSPPETSPGCSWRDSPAPNLSLQLPHRFCQVNLLFGHYSPR